jgi:hypothetical protein
MWASSGMYEKIVEMLFKTSKIHNNMQDKFTGFSREKQKNN